MVEMNIAEILGRRAPVEGWRASRGAVEVSSDVFTFWVFFSHNVVTSLLICSPPGWRRWRQPGSPCWPCWWKRSQKIVSHLILSLIPILIASSSWSSSQMPPLLLGADSGCQFLCGDGLTCLPSHQVFVVWLLDPISSQAGLFKHVQLFKHPRERIANQVCDKYYDCPSHPAGQGGEDEEVRIWW